MSKQQKDEDFNVTVNLELPSDHVADEEIRLITACVGELLKLLTQAAETKRIES